MTNMWFQAQPEYFVVKTSYNKNKLLLTDFDPKSARTIYGRNLVNHAAMRIANAIGYEHESRQTLVGDDQLENYILKFIEGPRSDPRQYFLGEFAVGIVAKAIFCRLEKEAQFFIFYASPRDGCKFTAQVVATWKNRHWTVNFRGLGGEELAPNEVGVELLAKQPIDIDKFRPMCWF